MNLKSLSSRPPWQLSVQGRDLMLDDGSLLNYCQRAYRLGMAQLKWRHWNGADAARTTVGRSVILDQLIQTLWSALIAEQSLVGEFKRASWIALGEYGRLELAPCGSADLLILVKSKTEVPTRLDGILRLLPVLIPESKVFILSAKECVHRAQNHFPFAFGLMSARRICGEPGNFQELTQRMHATWFRNRLSLVVEMMEHLKNMRPEQGSSLYHQEFDVNLGAGGLLEIFALMSGMKLLTGNEEVSRSLDQKLLSVREWEQLCRGHQKLALIRNHLHFVSGQKMDVLTRERLSSISQFLSDRGKLGGREVGAQLRDILLHRQRIHHVVSRFFKRSRQRYSQSADLLKAQYLKLVLPEPSPNREAVGPLAGPESWMKLFRYAQAEPALFTEELEEGILTHLWEWDSRSFDMPAMHSDFLLILRQRGRIASALERMRELGFLSRYLPELARLDCLPQLESHCKHTVGEQVFRAISCLERIAASASLVTQDYSRVLDQVADPSLIYLAILLSSSGRQLKSKITAHEAVAAKVLRRLGLSHDSQERILFLIREQRLLHDVSQRRDIDDPLILQGLCETVETSDNLNMLLLVTYAQVQSLEEGDWSERKDFLLWSLYFKIYDRLMFDEDISEPEYAQVAAVQQKVLESLGQEFDVDTVLKHFVLLPEKYALYTPITQILSHIRLCEKLGDQTVLTQWNPHPQGGYTELIVATRDLPGRFSQIAGTLASQKLSILSAQLNTRDDGVVIDTFQVSDAGGGAMTDREAWTRIDRLLGDVIRGEVDVSQLFAARPKAGDDTAGGIHATPRIRIDNDIASQSTVIEVQTMDRQGLGYQIARALAELELNIVSAKLATERGHAFDVFYVQTREGEKVTSSFQMTEILERLRLQLR